MTWPFGDIRPFSARVILADPPWSFENWGEGGQGRAPDYPCMSLEELKALPVGHLARGDAALFCWVTDPLLPRALEVIEAWGFTYRTVAFTWAKRTRSDAGWHMGLGYYTRANPEICILATVGDMGRPKSRGVRQLVVEPVREHSRKPDRIYADIEALFDGPYVELFARNRRPGWASWGNDVDRFSPEQVQAGVGAALIDKEAA